MYFLSAKEGCWDGSVGKGTSHQSWRPEFNPWGPPGSIRKLIASSDLLLHAVVHVCNTHTHTHTHRDTHRHTHILKREKSTESNHSFWWNTRVSISWTTFYSMLTTCYHFNLDHPWVACCVKGMDPRLVLLGGGSFQRRWRVGCPQSFKGFPFSGITKPDYPSPTCSFISCYVKLSHQRSKSNEAAHQSCTRTLFKLRAKRNLFSL